MKTRLNNPATLLPETMQAINLLYKATHSAGVPPKVLELVHLRASQINGCGVCVDMARKGGKKADLTEEQLFSASAWRETPYYSEAERAALELAEHMTRLADRGDGVPDAVWEAAARHFDEKQLAALVLWISVSNLFNRINVTTRQMAPQNW